MATYASIKYNFGTQLTGEIPTAAIADDAVTLAKMASGTDGNIITYDASGNPAVVATGSADQVLTSAGSGAPPTMATAAGGGMASVQAFITSGTWTKPSGIKSVRVQLCGSGAHGSNGGWGGGAGGYSEKFIDVTNISSETVTVGPAGSSGSTSSFGSHCSATGGAAHTGSRDAGYGGAGTGGHVNIRGGGGQTAAGLAHSGGGGSSYFGGSSPGTANTTDSTLHAAISYGAGGIGVYNGYTQGSAASVATGVVIVYEYK